MTPENKALLTARLWSLLWRAGVMLILTVLAFISQNIGLFSLNPTAVVIIGLVVNEVTKYINDNVKLGRTQDLSKI